MITLRYDKIVSEGEIAGIKSFTTGDPEWIPCDETRLG
jgi:hypothetical protein